MNRKGYVYFAKVGEAVKIGWSKNVDRRMAALSTYAAHPVDLLGYVIGDRECERRQHERFASHRLRGEWFRATPRVLWAIRWLCDSLAQHDASRLQLCERRISVLNEAVHTLLLLNGEEREPFSRVIDSIWRAIAEAERQRDWWRDPDNVHFLAPRVFGDTPLNPVAMPSRSDVLAFMASVKAQAEAYRNRPADYLDLRAIFDDEAEPVAGAA